MLSADLAALIPRNGDDLLRLQFESAVLYLVLSALIHGLRGFKFDMIVVVKAAIAGLSLPPSLLLTLILYQPKLMGLLAQPIINLYLSIAGLIFSVLSVHSLITGPRKP